MFFLRDFKDTWDFATVSYKTYIIVRTTTIVITATVAIMTITTTATSKQQWIITTINFT